MMVKVRKTMEIIHPTRDIMDMYSVCSAVCKDGKEKKCFII